jgi:NitT/TauT family transport system substrate-binding protein
MARFRIQPHGRLQEWVAQEKGYFQDEGLDYEFVSSYYGGTLGYGSAANAGTQTTTPVAAPTVTHGAFESYADGRACEVSSACHWAVNMASSAQHGRMWGHAYSIAPSGIYVPAESPIRAPEDLANVEVGVSYHSGSHFSTLQNLESYLPREAIKLSFIGQLMDRVAALLDRKIQAANVFSAPSYLLEQQGFRKVLDTTFMEGFLVPAEADIADVEKYFRALQRAQRDVDLGPERYKHYFLREIPEKYHAMADVRTFGPGERLVFEPYTREVYEATHRWMEDWNLFPPDQVGHADYSVAVLA